MCPDSIIPPVISRPKIQGDVQGPNPPLHLQKQRLLPCNFFSHPRFYTPLESRANARSLAKAKAAHSNGDANDTPRHPFLRTAGGPASPTKTVEDQRHFAKNWHPYFKDLRRFHGPSMSC